MTQVGAAAATGRTPDGGGGGRTVVLARGLADPPEPTLEELALECFRAGRATAEQGVAA